MTLKIGPLELQSNVLLAPLSGVTDFPFRKIAQKYGATYVISEMIASEAMVRHTRQTLRMAKGHQNHASAIQLAGYDPSVMAEAAKLAVDLGARVIDINMGCPVKKIVKNFAGSALMQNEARAANILKAVTRAVSVPVTLKMRKGWDESNQNAPRLAKIAEELGVQMITIHGRTRCQLFSGSADWKFIRRVKEAVRIPIIGNGDVKTCEDAKTLLEESGADGVMIGRGCYGKPWFIRHVSHFLQTGKRPEALSPRQEQEIVLEHLEEMLTCYGNMEGVRVARKHLGWYSKGYPQGNKFRAAVNNTTCRETLFSLVKKFYHKVCHEQENTTMH